MVRSGAPKLTELPKAFFFFSFVLFYTFLILNIGTNWLGRIVISCLGVEPPREEVVT